MTTAFRVIEYRATVRHDAGIIDIHTWATSPEAAARIIMAAEGCPASSILSIAEA